MLSHYLADEEATKAFGASLYQALASNDGAVIFLEGDLGAGKSCLARGFLHAGGVRGPMRSPTYTLMELYRLQHRFCLHLDLYRIADPVELDQLGLRDYSQDQAIWLVEWPSRGDAFLPAPDVRIELSVQGSGRRVNLHSRDEQLLDQLKTRVPL